jgi:hypothetical protein
MKQNREYVPPVVPEPVPSRRYYAATMQIFPGVRGTALKRPNGLIHIPMIIGKGEGQVGRMLDCLSQCCRVVYVTSKKLRGMLERRGYTCEIEQTADGPMDVWKPPLTH